MFAVNGMTVGPPTLNPLLVWWRSLHLTWNECPISERRAKTWNLLPVILAGAFIIRVALALSTDAIPHPDAIFQYLEQAHRIVFGNGIVPWEYRYGIRSWLIPGFIALILKSCARPWVREPGFLSAGG